MIDGMHVFQLSLVESFCGLIVPCRSGVLYKHQAGGVHCAHPEVEGVFLPLPFDLTDDSVMSDEVMAYGDATQEAVDDFLEANDLEELFESLPVEFARTVGLSSFTGEGWVPVRVRTSTDLAKVEFDLEGAEYLASFHGATAVIVYPNSD